MHICYLFVVHRISEQMMTGSCMCELLPLEVFAFDVTLGGMEVLFMVIDQE